MKIDVLRQVIYTLQCDYKVRYELEAKSKNKVYIFSINNGTAGIIEATYINSYDGSSLNTLYESVDDLNIEDVEVTRLTARKETINGLLIFKYEDHFYRETELFMRLFKLKNDSFTFIIKDGNVSRLCYYISARVFYVEEQYDSYELFETDLFKLYSSMNNASITLVGKMVTKTSKSKFIYEQEQIASKRGKRFKNIRNGVYVK